MKTLESKLFNTVQASCAALRARIHHVRPAGFDAALATELVSFELDGEAYTGALRGRNRDLCLGFDPQADAAIALRVLLDGNASPAMNADEHGTITASIPAVKQDKK